jgi:alpha-2-macroglobulin
MVVLDDPLPSGLEAVDLTLRTVSPFGIDPFAQPEQEEERPASGWHFGRWDSGMWSPFDHNEIRDDRVVYFARVLWKGTYSATYLARATTSGRFTASPAHAEEMYNPAVHGRSGGGMFTVNGSR